MKTNSEIRQDALALMKGNWSSAIAVIVVLYLVIYGISIIGLSIDAALYGDMAQDSVVGQSLTLIASILVLYPMSFSACMIFLNFARGEEQPRVGLLFKAFSEPYYTKSVAVYLLMAVFTFLWTLLLIVPGIIKALSYSLAPYILADNPNLTADQAIEKSMKMMDGHKMDLFLMMLGYLGLTILSMLALGIPMLWLLPYYQTVLARFYEEVKGEYRGE